MKKEVKLTETWQNKSHDLLSRKVVFKTKLSVQFYVGNTQVFKGNSLILYNVSLFVRGNSRNMFTFHCHYQQLVIQSLVGNVKKSQTLYYIDARFYPLKSESGSQKATKLHIQNFCHKSRFVQTPQFKLLCLFVWPTLSIDDMSG